MSERNGAGELHNEGDVQSSVARCREFIERVSLCVLSDCATEGRVISKQTMMDCMFDAFLTWATSPGAARILGMSGEVSAVFLAAHGSEFRARFAPAIDSAYASWDRANSVNGAHAN
jgi:hypothetical protein